MKCRDCKFFALADASDKAGRVRKAWAVKCLWQSTEVYPLSIVRASTARPIPGYMTAEDGEGCMCFKKRGE